MKNIIVITGHAHYASGLLSALEMIAGHNDDIMAVDFTEDKDIVGEYEQIIKKHNSDSILFMCDLLGGTPFKEVSKLGFNNINIEVVTGCNLGSLLEISLVKDSLSLKELLDKIVRSSQKNIVQLNKDMIFIKEEQEHDGI